MDPKLNRKISPEIKAIDKIGTLNYNKSMLDNGVPVYQIHAGTQDVVKIEFVFDAGICQQTKRLASTLTNKMLPEGTQSFSAFEIAERIDKYGAFLGTTIDKDYSSITLYSLNKHLANLLPILSEIILQPSFPQKEFGVLRNKLKQEYSVNQEKVKYLAQTNLMQLIFGKDHAYGQLSVKDDYSNIQLDDIKNFFQAKYSMQNCKIFVSGQLGDDLGEQLNHFFGKIKPLTFQTNENSFVINGTTERIHKIKKQNGMQSAIRIGKPLFTIQDPDYLGLLILNTVLGGYFGSRLMSNIREDKGYTYGIGSSIYSLKHSGLFTIITEVGNQYVDDTLKEIYKEISLLQNELIPNSELALVKNYLLGQMIRSMDGPFHLHEKLKYAVLHELNVDHYQTRVEVVKNITSEALRELAIKHFQKDSLTELVVGN